MKKMQHYVMLVPITKGGQTALVLKNRPANLAGRWNFVGGKVEDGETAEEAVLREYTEETGVVLVTSMFKKLLHFCIIKGTDYQIDCFTLCADYIEVMGVKTVTSEFVKGWELAELKRMGVKDPKWLITDVLSLLHLAEQALAGENKLVTIERR